MSNEPSANGSAVPEAATTGTAPRAWRNWATEMSSPTARTPCSASQREHCAAPAPTSSARWPPRSFRGPSNSASASVSPSGPHTNPAP